jgi:hypothetical protein
MTQPLSEFVTHPDFPGWRAFIKHGRLEYTSSPPGRAARIGFRAINKESTRFSQAIRAILQAREFASQLEGIFLP